MAARFPIGVRYAYGQSGQADRVHVPRIDETVPDQLPPFLVRHRPIPYRTIADADGRLWIPQLPAPGSGGAPAMVFDVVDRRGRLVDRVRMPPDAVPVAFAPGVVLAMQWLEPGPDCPHPAPGTQLPAEPACTNNLARLVSFRVR
jgi:hypothetical protein